MATTHAATFPHARGWSASEFTDLLAQKHCFACGDARCFALVRVIADEAELLTIATHPDHQRQGLARAVMAQWLAKAGAQGATHAFLEVAADNPAALALYRACGFQKSGHRARYYARKGSDPVDAVMMMRDLSLR